MTEHDDSADVWAVRLAAVYERLRADRPELPPRLFESLEAYLERTGGLMNCVECSGQTGHAPIRRAVWYRRDGPDGGSP